MRRTAISPYRISHHPLCASCNQGCWLQHGCVYHAPLRSIHNADAITITTERITAWNDPHQTTSTLGAACKGCSVLAAPNAVSCKSRAALNFVFCFINFLRL